MYRKMLIAITVLLLIVASSQFGLAAQIRLAWNPKTEADLAGYKVYYGTSSKSYGNPIDVGNETTFALTGLTQGQTYFIAVTAYDTSNNESGFSIEVSAVAKELTPSSEVTAPTVTASISESNNSGSNVYVASYDQNTDSMPIGNVWQYEVSSTNNSQTGAQTGDIVDSNQISVIDENNQIRGSSQSTWSSQTDGNKVDSGGVGEVLVSRSKPRNIFTKLEDPNLMAESNEFATSNEKITPELLGLDPLDEVGREKLIQFIHGFEAQTQTTTTKGKDKLKFTKRKWILGPVVNSRPLVIPYGKSKSVIFVGANDGMLHAFDNTTGEELWGFIPKELLGRLKELMQDNQLKFYVDGSPKASIRDSQKIIIFGLRKGGNYYYGLDVTDPQKPKFLWKIGPETTGYSEQAQTWSTPRIGRIKYGDNEKAVFFIGGGYDKNQNRKALTAGDQKGRAVYAVDVLTGAQVWRWDYQKDPNMIYSIPSDVAGVDVNGDGYVDRFYVGDTGGRLWRFDIKDPNPNNWTGKIVFKSSKDVGDRRRKIFNPPDVTLEKGYEMVLFGTGDREHPNETKNVNRIYAFRDRGSNSTLTEDNLANVTNDFATVNNFENKEGWFISLEAGKGEKVLAPPVVVYGVAYFTTYTPSPDASEGIAQIYALNYNTGGPIFNFNPKNDTNEPNIDLPDRSRIIGKGIPSGPVFSAVKGRPIAFTGIEGGIYRTPLRGNSTIIQVWWRELRK